MNCTEIQDKLTAYLLGELDAEHADEVRRHLQECPECRNAAGELEATINLVRENLAAAAESLPLELSAERRQAIFTKSVRRASEHQIFWGVGRGLLKVAALFGIIVALSGLLLPNLGSVREKARRVNDLANLNSIYKTASAWGLDPQASFRPAFPPSLDQLVAEKEITPEILVNPETGKPVEYYPASASDVSDGDHVLLVSQRKGGRNIVKVAGQGMWVEDGTPEAAKLDQQLAEQKKEQGGLLLAAKPSYGTYPEIADKLTDMGTKRADLSTKSRKTYEFEDGAELALPPVTITPPPIAVSGGILPDGAKEPDKPRKAIAVSVGGEATGAAQALPPKPQQETKVESKELKVTTTPSDLKSQVRRITTTAPSEFIKPAAPSVAPAMTMADIKVPTDMSKKIESARIARLQGVAKFQKSWNVTAGPAERQGDELSMGWDIGDVAGKAGLGGKRGGVASYTRAKFTMYRARYQDGDWDCKPEALPNLMRQIRAWSKGRIDANVLEEVLDIGSDKLFTVKPPFIFLTGTKGIRLVENEIVNLRDYLLLGGAIWADAAMPGKSTHFDISLRREMKRVLPDRDFEIVPENHEMFNTFFENVGLPPGLSNSCLPAEQIMFDDKLAILYTLNGYSTLWNYPLSRDDKIDWEAYWMKQPAGTTSTADPGITDELVRNAYRFGINNVVHILTRYQRQLQLLPKALPVMPGVSSNQPSVPTNLPTASTALIKTNAPADDAAPEKQAPRRALGVNPFVNAAENQFSTFGIDVDTASYTLSRNYIRRGELPPPEEVRTEEFVNYFDYAYQPPKDRTFAVYSEIGAAPLGGGLALLKIGVQAQRLGREQKRPLALTLLIDTSGSMATPDRIELLKSALRRMIERLDRNDLVAVIQFDTQARLLLAHTPAAEKSKILAVIDALQTSGSTNLEEGMKLAYAIAGRAADSRYFSRVMLLSDGVANLGTVAAEEILDSVEKHRKQGIYCSVFGFGSGTYNDAMLQTLADKGDGAYAFIDSDEEAERALVEDLAARLNVVARDAKIQVEFNPKRVIRFRQLGYEKRLLKKEEFRDDTVDAGEVGSGQCATALYELELNQNYSEPIGTVRVRYRNVFTGLVEEMEQPIVLQGNPPAFEAMGAHFRLAAGVAAFAEILRGSPYVAGRGLEDVARVLRPVALELNVDRRIGELKRMTEYGLVPKFTE